MEKKFRILYLTTTSQLYGAEKMVYELAKRINKDRFEPMVCTIKDDLDNQLLSQLRKEGVKTACLKIEKKWEVWKTIHFFSIIKSFKPDILQSFLFFDNILARIFGKFMSIPVIISGQRNVEIHRSQLRNFIDRVTLPLADYIVSNSKAGKQILVNREKIDEKKIKVIYNGIDIQDFNKKQKAELADLFTSESFFSNKFIVGFIGSLTQQKGLNVLFEAAAELKEKSLNIILVLIGEGKRKQELEQLTRELGIEDIVYFTGYKDMGWKFMRLFDVLVSPSLWEGMPNVVIEAMAQGIIVVATNVGGIPELIEEGKDGFLVESKNIHALVDKISYIFNLPEEKRIEIRENAQKKIIKNYSIEKMVREYESLYQDLLQNR
jgi:glycosyltransferase involved in cell wall biosynthesis